MNALDFVLITFILIEALQGARIGLIQSFMSLASFWLGLLVGALLAPFTIHLVDSPSTMLLMGIMTVFGMATIFGLIGTSFGHHLHLLSQRFKLQKVNAVLGAAFSVVVTIVIIWLVSAVFTGMPYRGLNAQLRNSALMNAIHVNLPPAPSVMAKIPNLLSPYNFPQVFIGKEPRPRASVDSATQAEIEQAVAAAGPSTVRIESVGCGGLVFGSGFVVAPNLVITNAHVVAGITSPVVDIDGTRLVGKPVYFNPDQDVALLWVDDLTLEPLTLSDDSFPQDTRSVVLGYPGGGPFRAEPATILETLGAKGRDIYNEKPTLRVVYALQTTVESGNSGGPLVLPDGTVIGLIFARSDAYENLGYALTSAQVKSLISEASTTGQVDTHVCVSE
jgi:uncharacterized membrane protein required for colicin V production